MLLLTRANLDGIACAVLITTMEQIEQVTYAEPRDIETEAVEVKPLCAIANLPYHRNCSVWFDHHDKAELQPLAKPSIKGLRGTAPSCARLVYNFYDTARLARFDDFLRENDRIASAKLSAEEVLNPEGWVLLAYTLDSHMGIEVFAGYANGLVSAIKTGASIQHLLETPEVKGRVNRFKMDMDDFKEELGWISHLEGDVIVTDLRRTEILPAGNRFVIFGLYPEAAVGLRILKHSDPDMIAIRMAKSIFNRTCKVHLGHLAAEFGGGGLDGASGFVIPANRSDEVVADLLQRLQSEEG